MKSTKFVICIENDEYPGALEKRKLYPVLDDPAAAKVGLIKVIDESGEAYLYSIDMFIAATLDESAEATLCRLG